jgi:hypothetical protein
MLARLSTMSQYISVGATRLFQGIRQDWHLLKAAVVADRLGSSRGGVGPR